MKTFDSFNFKNGKAMKRMKYWLTGLALLFTLWVQGQGWMKYFNSEPPPSSIYVVTSLQTSDNSTMVLANRRVNSTTVNTFPIDTSEILLYKFDENGVMLFSKKIFSSAMLNIAEDFCATSDGGFVIVGSTVTPLSPFEAESRPLTIKVDSDGNILWLRSGQLLGTHSKVVEDSNSNISVIFAAKDSFGLSKLTAQGNLLWAKKYASSGFGDLVVPHGVLPMDGGGTMIAGNIGIGPTQFVYHPLLLKVDTVGNILWHKIYDENAGFTERHSIAQVPEIGRAHV